MQLTQLLQQEAEAMYAVTEGLFKLVDASQLGWKPESGKNWMTVGQLLQHCSTACGSGVKGFVSGDWGLPEGVSFADMPADQMLPPAKQMPAASSVEAALQDLAADKKVCMQYLAEAGEQNLLSKKSVAPWGGPEVTLFQHLSHMIGHLGQHKGQLFYYLKLLGKNVDTGNLWGM